MIALNQYGYTETESVADGSRKIFTGASKKKGEFLT